MLRAATRALATRKQPDLVVKRDQDSKIHVAHATRSNGTESEFCSQVSSGEFHVGESKLADLIKPACLVR